MAGRTQGPIPTKAPVTRNISARSIVQSLDGPERPYPVYTFSGRRFPERPRHNPFQGL